MTTLAKLAKQLRTIIAEQYQESNYIFKVQFKKDSAGVSVLTITVKSNTHSGTVKLWLDYDDAFDKYILQLNYHRGCMRFETSLLMGKLEDFMSEPKYLLLDRAVREFDASY